MDVKELEAKLGVEFSEKGILERALTHGSINQTGGSTEPNKKLAFLGDAVIELVIREHVFKTGQDSTLGKLSMDADEEVRNQRLAERARGISLGRFLRLGPGAERERDQDSVLATALEAVFGAVFKEHGYEAASTLATRVLLPAAEIPASTKES